MLAFNSLAQSHINYCSLVWGCTNKSKIESLFVVQKKAMRATMPGWVNYFYQDGLCPTHTKPAFSQLYVLTVQNIILKNIMIFLNKVHHYPHLLPLSVKQTISSDSPSPDTVSDYTSEWYSTYNSSPYNTSVFFKGPLLYTSIMSDNDNIKNVGPNSFKNSITEYLHNVQCPDHDENEWNSSNFPLYSIAGLRRSDRIRSQPAVYYTNQL